MAVPTYELKELNRASQYYYKQNWEAVKRNDNKRNRVLKLLKKGKGKFFKRRQVTANIKGIDSSKDFFTKWFPKYSAANLARDLKKGEDRYDIAHRLFKADKARVLKMMEGTPFALTPYRAIGSSFSSKIRVDPVLKALQDKAVAKKTKAPFKLQNYQRAVETLLPIAQEKGIVPEVNELGRPINSYGTYNEFVKRQRIDPIKRLFAYKEFFGVEHPTGITRAVDLADAKTLGRIVPILGNKANALKGRNLDSIATQQVRNILSTPGKAFAAQRAKQLIALNKALEKAATGKYEGLPKTSYEMSGVTKPKLAVKGFESTLGSPLIKNAEIAVNQYIAQGGETRKSFPKLGENLQRSILSFTAGNKRQGTSFLKKALLDSVKGLSESEQIRICKFASAGGVIGDCRQIINKNPVKATEIFSKIPGEATGALSKLKNTATTFLGTLGKFGARAAPLAAVAALGAVAEPLVKQFRNDDPSTYMTDVDQQKGVLLSLVESETPKVDEEILKWQMPALGAATVAGAVPGAGELYKQRRAIRPDKLIGPMEKGVGPARAALGIKGVLGKALGASFSPLAVAATLPMTIAAQRSAGTDYSDIAADPTNWMGPAFAASGADIASKGIKNPMLLRALRLGMSPGALRMGSRFLGLPGLALTAGMWGYDKYKNWGKDNDSEFKVRKYTDDD